MTQRRTGHATSAAASTAPVPRAAAAAHRHGLGRRRQWRLHREYPHLPLYITENGASYEDLVTATSTVDDVKRTEYVHAHLAAVHDAIDAGVDVRGYYLWTLVDNFEWAWGFSQRFGIVHVDCPSGRRTPKASAHWFGSAAAANGVLERP